MSCSENLFSMKIWYILIKINPLYFVSFVAILRVNISFSLLLLHKTNDIWIISLTYNLADFCCVLSVDYFGYIIYNGRWPLLSNSDISPFFPYLLAKVFNTILNSWLLILEWWFNFLFARRHFFFKSQINSEFWVLFLYILSFLSFKRLIFWIIVILRYPWILGINPFWPEGVILFH